MRIDEKHEDSVGLSSVEVVRAVLGVTTGYVIFAAAVLLFFALTGRDSGRHDNGVLWLVAIGVSALFAAFAGYLCVAVAGRAALIPAATLAALLGISVAITIGARFNAGSARSQRTMVSMFAAAALLGGAVRRRQSRGFQVHHDRP
jgi:hypothetical protein